MSRWSFTDEKTIKIVLIPGTFPADCASEEVIYEQIARNCAERVFPPIGCFGNTGTHKLRNMKRGEKGPIKLIESAPGEGALYWCDIQYSLSEFATTITCDRASSLCTTKSIAR